MQIMFTVVHPCMATRVGVTLLLKASSHAPRQGQVGKDALSTLALCILVADDTRGLVFKILPVTTCITWKWTYKCIMKKSLMKYIVSFSCRHGGAVPCPSQPFRVCTGKATSRIRTLIHQH